MLPIIFSLLLSVAQSMHLPVILYKYTDAYEWIWNDKGTGGKYDVSFWKPKISDDYCSLGDVATNSWKSPSFKTLLVENMNDHEAFKHPIGFERIWYNLLSGGYWNVSVYRMEPPSGYTCIGDAVTRSWDPPSDSLRYCCVKKQYLEAGKLAWTYNNTATGSLLDFSVWTVNSVPKTDGLHGGNFLAVDDYSKDDLQGYVLGGNGIKFIDASKKINKIVISNVKYDLRNEKKTAFAYIGDTMCIENESGISQNYTTHLKSTEITNSTYSFNKSIGVGVTADIKAGIPDIGNIKTTISAITNFTLETGIAIPTSIPQTIAAQCLLAPGNKTTASIVFTRYTATIPYNAMVHIFHYDGNNTKENINGVYEGESVTHHTVKYGDFEQIPEHTVHLIEQLVAITAQNVSDLLPDDEVLPPHANKQLRLIASNNIFGLFSDDEALTDDVIELLEVITDKKDYDILNNTLVPPAHVIEHLEKIAAMSGPHFLRNLTTITINVIEKLKNMSARKEALEVTVYSDESLDNAVFIARVIEELKNVTDKEGCDLFHYDKELEEQVIKKLNFISAESNVLIKAHVNQDFLPLGKYLYGKLHSWEASPRKICRFLN